MNELSRIVSGIKRNAKRMKEILKSDKHENLTGNVPPLHWFCFTYAGRDATFGKSCTASTYTGYQVKKVTMKMIRENKKNARVTDEAVLIAVSYLGEMSKETFTAE